MNVRSYNDVFESETKSVRFRSDGHLAATPTTGSRSRAAEDNFEEKLTPSPTGYRDYTPPPELVQNRYKVSGSSPRRQLDCDSHQSGNFYTTVGGDDAKNRDETFTHKVRDPPIWSYILVLCVISFVYFYFFIFPINNVLFVRRRFLWIYQWSAFLRLQTILLGDSGVGKRHCSCSSTPDNFRLATSQLLSALDLRYCIDSASTVR